MNAEHAVAKQADNGAASGAKAQILAAGVSGDGPASETAKGLHMGLQRLDTLSRPRIDLHCRKTAAM